MSKIWPFAFFPGMNSSDTPKEDIAEAEAAVEEAAVEEVSAEEEAVVPAENAEEAKDENKPLPEDDVDNFDDDSEEDEEDVDADEEDDDVDGDFPELEAELEIALDEAHREAVKKQRTQNKVVAGLAILGAVGLATGFGIRAYLKRR